MAPNKQNVFVPDASEHWVDAVSKCELLVMCSYAKLDKGIDFYLGYVNFWLMFIYIVNLSLIIDYLVFIDS